MLGIKGVGKKDLFYPLTIDCHEANQTLTA
jgi:hypothetical protein